MRTFKRTLYPFTFLFFILSCGNESSERTKTTGTQTYDPKTGPAATTDPAGGGTASEFVAVTSGTNIFQIFKYEATLADGSAVSKSGVVPAVSIDFAGAKAACTKGGFRLCTETEWTAACRGPSNLKYAFAATADGPPTVVATCDVARTENNTSGSLPSKSGSHAACKTSGLELFDMIGNASEWVVMTDGTTAKSAGAAFYQTADESNCDGELTATGATGEHMPAATATSDVGFRCCKD